MSSSSPPRDLFELTFTGELLPADLPALEAQLSEIPPAAHLRLDLSDADLEDATVVARLSSRLRDRARTLGRLELIGAPQVLTHTLYRVGALAMPQLVLIDPRDELGSAG